MANDVSVEFGAGPMPFISLLDERYRQGEVVYSDRNIAFVREAKPGFIKGEKGFEIDAQRTPFKSSSISTVLAKDLFGSHGETSQGRFTGHIGDIEEIVKEWGRILKADGRVVIIESMAPETRYSNLSFLQGHFEKAHFQVDEVLKEEEIRKLFDPKFANLQLVKAAIDRPGSFALILKKTD